MTDWKTPVAKAQDKPKKSANRAQPADDGAEDPIHAAFMVLVADLGKQVNVTIGDEMSTFDGLTPYCTNIEDLGASITSLTALWM